jgi:hypothetical protein
MAGGVEVLARGIQDYPPLPEALPADRQRTPAGKPLLQDGCYLIYYALFGLDIPSHRGTIRVETRTGQLFASGDLYQHDQKDGDPGLAVGSLPPLGPGIPIFSIASYRHYLRVTQVEPSESGFRLTFEAQRFSPVKTFPLNGNISFWVLEGTFTAQMALAAAPPGYPPEQFFVGEVADESGQTVGQLQMGWVSPFLRKGTVEIDRVPESEVPWDNGEGVTWRSVFEAVGWDLTAVASDGDVTKSRGPVWTAAEAHFAMLARRDKRDLDAEWRYHLLAVQLIDYPDGDRGVMYDRGNDDVNRVPREGLLISSHYVFASKEDRWGLLKGKRTGTTAAYFRTAVHEVGHTMGLGHNNSGFAFMSPTGDIARNAPEGMPFPTNIVWSFAPLDEHRLRHWPDIVVRPGGLGFGEGSGSPLP